jgi:hypothetical protein
MKPIGLEMKRYLLEPLLHQQLLFPLVGSSSVFHSFSNAVTDTSSRYFRNKKREYLKDKINELATNSKNKNIRDMYRGINEFQMATNLEIT